MKVPKRNDKLLKELSNKRQFYEHVAITKGDADDYWASGFYQSLLIEAVNQILTGVCQQQIIDVGCGDGRTVLSLVKQKNRVVGVDIAHTRLSRAQHKTARYAPYTLFVQTYAEALPLKKEIFDGAICTEVLEHVVDDDALLKGLTAILRSHAWVLVTIPTVSLNRYFEMWNTKRPIYCDPNEHIREFTHYKIPWFVNNFILIMDLQKKFKDVGLHVVKRYAIGFELPLWVTKFKIGQLFEKYLKNKKVNKFFSSMPIIKNFSVYTVFVLRKGV